MRPPINIPRFTRRSHVLLNGLHQSSGHFHKAGSDIYAKNQDLFGSCRREQNGCIYNSIGTFSRILTNPPFVALPESSSIEHNVEDTVGSPALIYQQALYAAGGTDGLDIVRRIMESCVDVLDTPMDPSNAFCLGEGAQLLMVTEVPNVEESCQMLQSFVRVSFQSSVSIRVAYVVDDVVVVNIYEEERAKERGIYINEKYEFTKWLESMAGRQIRNRALVLVSVQRTSNIPELKLFRCDGIAESLTDSWLYNSADKEDAFLTKEGIMFVSNLLLSNLIV